LRSVISVLVLASISFPRLLSDLLDYIGILRFGQVCAADLKPGLTTGKEMERPAGR
jgi:hypothetical protein